MLAECYSTSLEPEQVVLLTLKRWSSRTENHTFPPEASVMILPAEKLVLNRKAKKLNGVSVVLQTAIQRTETTLRRRRLKCSSVESGDSWVRRPATKARTSTGEAVPTTEHNDSDDFLTLPDSLPNMKTIVAKKSRTKLSKPVVGTALELRKLTSAEIIYSSERFRRNISAIDEWYRLNRNN